jgi:hypothetical protein
LATTTPVAAPGGVGTAASMADAPPAGAAAVPTGAWFELIPVPRPVAPVPVDPVSIAPVPVEPGAVEPGPVEPVPVEPVPVEPVPVEPVLVEPVPVEPVPVESVPGPTWDGPGAVGVVVEGFVNAMSVPPDEFVRDDVPDGQRIRPMRANNEKAPTVAATIRAVR